MDGVSIIIGPAPNPDCVARASNSYIGCRGGSVTTGIDLGDGHFGAAGAYTKASGPAAIFSRIDRRVSSRLGGIASNRAAALKGFLFYRPEENPVDMELSLICHYLRFVPTLLPRLLWAVLRKHHTIRWIPGGVPVAIPDRSFAQVVDRTSRAAFALSPHTDQVNVLFVNTDHDATGMVYYVEDVTLYVYEQWLDLQGAYYDCKCPALRPQFHSP
ncbi:uncharacterized protein TRUGW13939_03437 [Talaromyces rugulosus]|uniref:Uncharacterized protein n=1 Tax=Talaromyces rugulosus TaxID=121627 RepID=A0A7H8QR68_TALRU|nr:uncharacterized protein TRUGW13939_03437 [Talaromyces rugulosus]QKX56336.1 hypothetical protein TRUGW13939_03437 [Talaromyces rugulosus]